MSMGMGMGGGGHGGMGMGLMRSLRRDNSVLQQQLPKGIVRRIATFAHPYRKALGVFLVLIIIDAVIGAANPLLYRAIIDTGIGTHPGHGRPGFIVELALVVAGLAVFDAVLSLWQRWVSARIGEGLIYDMRTRVFEHIQKMPIAFFTRTQTGALVSRLNNDVLGAQQAFTDTFSSVVSNVICQDKTNMAASVTTTVMRLPTTDENVSVKACCAPSTSLLRRETRAPV